MPKSLRWTRGAWLVASSTAFAAQPSGEPVASPGPFGPKEASPQTKLDRAFQSAQIEGCASGGALKFDPVPVWGDFVMGIFAVPYTLHAMATGRCKLLSR